VRLDRRVGRLHVITDTVLQDRFTHEELAEHAIAGGADTIQYRQKSGSTREMIKTVIRMVAICRGAGVPLIVNDRVDVAVAGDADGVHLGQEDLPVAVARKLLGEDRIIGVTAKTPDLIREGLAAGADYVGYGPIYLTGSKGDAGKVKGLAGLRDIVKQVDAPVVAIGGIDASTVGEVIGAGAVGLALISAVCCDEHPDQAARRVMAAIDGARKGSCEQSNSPS